MLIVTRRIGESLKIGQLEDVLEGPVTVTVLGMKGNQVRIGIDAQRSMRVDREEIRERIDAECDERKRKTLTLTKTAGGGI
ncbi:hypothetical protein BST95_08170 [Halioglobus japonicus]|uniref:Translational regulator CsrA n=1 Tax=Halioglobus japonicus TaxID=930805 RepID=A0AAP8SN69_9GAMM|nr:carbon storage regulator [Halioglobus japonicus]AQA18212.1 hypothetical protein BST95_08170 [Halioglobus japonicus]PLW86219.1 carbon storage regulator [Halioglobus japonicus]GHD13871.1 hypothetical protein GCM10007052_16850 [Halioglobus japonicus]